MKNILTALGVLTIATTAGNLGNVLNTNTENSKNNIENIASIVRKINKDGSFFVNHFSAGLENFWKTDYSPNFILLQDWKQYASNWNSFITKYKNFSFDPNSTYKMNNNSKSKSQKSINLNSQKLTSSIKESKDIIYYMYIKTDGSILGYTEQESWISIWHDDNNIYWSFVHKYHFVSYTLFDPPINFIANFYLKVNTVKFSGN